MLLQLTVFCRAAVKGRARDGELAKHPEITTTPNATELGATRPPHLFFSYTKH